MGISAEEAANIDDDNSVETNIGHIVEGGMTAGKRNNTTKT